MNSLVKPNAWVAIRLPSDTLKVVEIIPNTTISLGKYGAFQSNLILGRPYNLTYEIQDKKDGRPSELRIVPASEIHAETIAEEEAANNPGSEEKVTIGGDGVEFELVGENGEVLMRSNRETIDDSARQTLTMEEIEALKKDGADAGKDLIAKLMLSHTALDQKTTFSLAKYKLLKTKKYLRQFTVLPLDVPMLTHWFIEEKDPMRILEMREEMLALVGCWGNVHYSDQPPLDMPSLESAGHGRVLVVDEVGGLLVAAMAERMGILYEPEDDHQSGEVPESEANEVEAPLDADDTKSANGQQYPTPVHLPEEPQYAVSNTLTLIHSNAQPNLSLLKYFAFTSDNPPPSHPLTTHLKTLSWLQLLSPESDTTYSTPPPTSTPEELASWKSGKRGTYYRKRRRYARIRSVVDETRAGGFDSLVVASTMDPVSILRSTVPLLRGGAQVVVYSPTVEPLTHLADLYSTSRRTAFITSPPEPEDGDLVNWKGNEDFPLNPTLLLGVSVQTSKVRRWQVLPGRTHPLMTSRGGAEGYVLTGTRVIPAEGKVEARGKYKRRKVENGTATPDVVSNANGEGAPVANVEVEVKAEPV